MTKPSKDLGVVWVCFDCKGESGKIEPHIKGPFCYGLTKQFLPLSSYTALQVKLDMAIEALNKIEQKLASLEFQGQKLIQIELIANTALTNLKKDQA